MAKKIFTKQMILEKAGLLAEDAGLYKLSMRKIAKGLGSSITPIYESFNSKDDLIEALFQQIIRENLNAGSYYERNEQILLYGLHNPVLYRDIRRHAPSSHYFHEFHREIIELMKQEPALSCFDEKILKSLNFDITIYMNGLVEESMVSSLEPRMEENEYIRVLRQVTELFVLGYEKAIMA